MVWGISDIKDYEQFGKLMAKHSNDAVSIYPPIDLDGAMEQLAEQAANEDKSDPAASNFRLALIKLMNSVKKGMQRKQRNLRRNASISLSKM